MMAELDGVLPKVKSRLRIESVSGITRTLREHYRALHERFEIDCQPETFETHLRKLFSTHATQGAVSAASFLKKHRAEVCRVVSQWTGENLYNVHQVLEKMVVSSERLRLVASGDSATLKYRLIAMVTTVTMNTLHGSQHRVAL
ncbi:MAG: hypothetical protein R3C03_10120 [Pirellulaceae bacterium]